MRKKSEINGVGRDLHKLRVISICLMFSLLLNFGILRTTAVSNSEFLLTPDYVQVPRGQSFVVTVNLTNFQNLFAWSVSLKYNASVVNIVSVHIPPDDNIFSGHGYTPLLPQPDYYTTADTQDSLNYTIVAASLSGNDKVTVTNGILFSVNFTVVGEGYTTIVLATRSNPVHVTRLLLSYTECIDENLVSFVNFQMGSCTVVAGESKFNAPPLAYFTAIPPVVDNVTNLVINQNPPSGISNYVHSYKDFPTVFNASQSYDPDGNITEYIWSFGDGSNETLSAPNGSFVIHTYGTVGLFKVTLTVVDNGNLAENLSSTESSPYSTFVLSGLVLPYYNWLPFIYAVTALVAVGVAYYIFKETRRYVRTRREMRSRIISPTRKSS